MASEFKIKNGLTVVGDVSTSGTITINGALAATQSWVSSQVYLTSASLTSYATQSYVTSAIASLVDSAPGALDTLNELAAALGDDANFSTTVTNSIASKQPQLNGTGFVKVSGTSVTYDNNTYLTSYTETDTLASVTGRGATTATVVNFTAAGSAVNLTGLGSNITFKDQADVWTGYVGFSGNTGNLSFPGRNVEIGAGWNGTITLNNGSAGYDSGRILVPYGSVGIGISPAYKLDVNGSFNAVTSGVSLTYNSGILYHGNYYQFTSGNNYLLYARGGGDLLLGSNDTERIRITSAGNVGIGTTSPANKLVVTSDASPTNENTYAIAAASASDPAYKTIIGYDYTNDIGLIAAVRTGIGWRNLSIPQGSLGIGTYSPNAKFEVQGAADTSIQAIFQSSSVGNAAYNGGIQLGNAGSNQKSSIVHASAGDNTLTFTSHYSSGSGNKFIFAPGGTERVRFQQNGNVGIGTTSPTQKLEVGSFLDAVTNRITVAARYEYEPEFNFRLGQSGTGYDWIGAVISSGDDGNYNGKILFKTANAGRDTPTTKMIIKASGKVGIGTITPSEEFHVLGRGIFDGGSGNSSTDAVLYVTKATNDDWGLYVNNSGLDYGIYARMSPSANYAFAIHNGTTWTTRITGNAVIYLGEKNAIEGNYDSWLRLNNSSHYASGVYTPGVMRADGGFQVSGSTVLHTGNYNSYTPTLGGTGASGTWGISISGNAATATTAYSLSSNGGLTTQFGNATIGYAYAIANPQTGLFPASDNSNSILTVNRHPGDYYSQLGFSSNGNLYYRRFSAQAINTSLAWQTIWTSDSLTNLNQLSNGPGYLTSYSETDTLASVTGRGATTSTNISVNNVKVGTDGTYGGYGTIGFGGTTNGYNRVFGHSATSDGLFLASATGRGIFFRPNGGDIDRVTINVSGNVAINTANFTYTSGDNASVITGVVPTANKLFIDGSIQLLNNTDAIIIGRGASTFLTDEELGFGWGSGWYMIDGTYLRVRNNIPVYSTGSFYGNVFYDVNDANYFFDGNGESRANRLNLSNNQTLSANNAGGRLRISSYTNGESVINGNTHNITLGPYSTRTGDNLYYAGIAINGLMNYLGSTTYDVAPHIWIGGYYRDTPGSERSDFVVAIKSGTGVSGAGSDLPEPRFRVDYAGIASATGSFRAPIFYDSNDTNYYGDFASTSVMNSIRFGTSTNSGTLTGNSDWGMRLTTNVGFIQFGPANSSYAHIYTDRDYFYFNRDLLINNSLVITAATIGSQTVANASNATSAGYSDYVAAQTNPVGNFNVGLSRPKGASYTTMASIVTGAIKIKLPPGTPVHGMWKMTVKIYEYGQRGNGYTIELGCHLYPSTAHNRYQWMLTTDTGAVLPIRYGTDGTSGCVWIGENGTTWSYPQIHVTEFSNGFNNPGGVNWNTGTWGVTIGTIDNSVAVDGPFTTSLIVAASAASATTAGSSVNFMSTSHAGSYWLTNNWTGTHWQITSNHGAGVRVAYADTAGSATTAGALSSMNISQFTNNSGYITVNDTTTGIFTTFLGNATSNIGSGYTRVIRNENGTGGNPNYAPILHVAASDTMWQIAGAHAGQTTLVWRSGYSGAWNTPWWTIYHSGNFTDNSSNWNTAYGWGNHASAGYLTSITSGNVTTALGFTPYNATNPSGYISSITSGNVTTALGYTPYNATNPNGYITGISFASVSSKPTTISGYGITDAITTANIGSQSVSYATTAGSLTSMNISQFTNNSGYITGITSGQVTGALGYTPWNYGNVDAGRNIGAGTNLDTDLESGGAYSSYGAGGTSWNAPFSYGGVIAFAFTSGIKAQFGFDIRHTQSDYGDLWYRTKNNVGYSTWRTMWHSGNLTNLNQLTNGPGYITGYTEVDTLSSVTGRGATTTTPIIVTASEGREVAVYMASSYTTDDLVSGHEYGWYTDHWRLGMTRSGGQPGADFAVQWNGARRLSLTNGGNLTTTGTINASNLSGTNTGDQTNISGNAATATNVAWTGVTSRPTALSQFTNDLGNYGGWITGINSGNVTTALGFTPYNATNPSGYITSSALTPYLSLAGGTLNGNLTISGFQNPHITLTTTGGSYSYLELFDGTSYGYIIKNQSASTANGVIAGALYLYTDSSKPTQIVHSGVSNAAFLSGGDVYVRGQIYVGGNGASTGTQVVYNSGTWGINISGNAGTATYATTAGSAPNGSNQNSAYLVTPGEGNGLKFWADDNYKISMGASSVYLYGTVTDYSIKTQMNAGDPGRGFTWGRIGVVPIASLNATSGNMQIAGTFTASNFSGSSSGTNTGDQTNISGNAATATNVAYSGLTGTVPTWNQNTTGNSATVGGYAVSGSVGANTVVIRDGNNYIYAYYINSSVSETENPTINSFYTSNGDGWLRKSSVAHVKSQLGLGSMAYESSGTYQTVSGAINTGNIASQSVSYATISQQLTKFGDIYGQDWNSYFITAKLIVSNALGHTGANRPSDSYGYGTVLSYGETGGPLMQMYFPEDVANGGGAYRALAYRSGYNGSWSAWKTVVNQVGNTCTVAGSNGTGIEVHSGVGYNQDPLTYFLLRGQADSSWKALKIRLTGDAGGQDIEFRRIAENSTDARMFYVPRGANQVIFDYTVVTPSDSRLKDNLTPITNPVDKIKSLRGVEFDWNSGEHVGTHDVGLIAQDVEAVLPEAVTTQEDGYKNLAYTKVIPLLVEAMKEQQTMIEALRAEIELLKNK